MKSSEEKQKLQTNLPIFQIKTNKKNPYIRTVLVHWMRKFMILSLMTEEETFLTHVKIEALQTSVSESNDGIIFAYIAFSLMFSVL